MTQYLILAVIVKQHRNPFQPFSLIDLGHVDIIVWSPSEKPKNYGFYAKSFFRVVLSAFIPQEPKLVIKNTFTRIPAYWFPWILTDESFENLKKFMRDFVEWCVTGTFSYDCIRFNCLHLAIYCLRVAGLNPPKVPVKRVLTAKTLVPLIFIEKLMPNARYSIMDHELKYDSSTSITRLFNI